MKPLRLAPEAVAEAEQAAGWYDLQRRGLGTEFLDEVEHMLPLIGERPRSFPRLLDTAPESGIRRALLPRFPYGLVFMELADEIRVLAVAHAKHRPGYWLSRVQT